jgi:hypothetical protein
MAPDIRKLRQLALQIGLNPLRDVPGTNHPGFVRHFPPGWIDAKAPAAAGFLGTTPGKNGGIGAFFGRLSDAESRGTRV